MKTTYEFEPTMSWASPAKGDHFTLSAQSGPSVEVRLDLSRERATAIRRSLGRVLDDTDDDPAGGKWSIQELARLRNEIQKSDGVLDGIVPDVLDAIESYVRLIEYVVAAGPRPSL